MSAHFVLVWSAIFLGPSAAFDVIMSLVALACEKPARMIAYVATATAKGYLAVSLWGMA